MLERWTSSITRAYQRLSERPIVRVAYYALLIFALCLVYVFGYDQSEQFIYTNF